MTTIKPDAETYLVLFSSVDSLASCIDVKIDRFFAEDGFAGRRCGLDQISVRIRRSCNDDSSYILVIQSFACRGDTCAAVRSKLCRNLIIYVDNVANVSVRMRVQVSRMDGADSAATKYRDSEHLLPPESAILVEAVLVGVTDNQGLGETQ